MKNILLKSLVNPLYRVETHGFDKIDFTKKTIIMANHTSLLDAPLLAANLPKEVCFVVNTNAAKKYEKYIKGVRDYLTIDPNNPYSLREMIKKVNDGVPLVIFPEGRITRTGNTMKIYNGISYIALKTKANIYPLIINGAKQSKLSYIQDDVNRKLFPKVSLHIGEPFVIEENKDLLSSENKDKASQDILQKIQREQFLSKKKENINLYNELINSAKEQGMDYPILEDNGQVMTYKKFLIATRIFAHKLQPLLTNDKHVGMFLPNSVGTTLALFTLFKINKVPAMLNYSMGVQTIVDACETAELETIITSKKFIKEGDLEDVITELAERYNIIYLEDIKETIGTSDKLRALLEGNQYSTNEDNEIILFTSGSESKPKGVVLSHDNIFANAHQVASIIPFNQKDKMLNVLPVFHSFGLTAGTILPMLMGISSFQYPSPLHYKVIPELAYSKNATILFGTSTFLAGYGKYAHHYDFYNLKYVVAGAEKLKDEVRDLWLTKFGIRIMQGYGATETSPVLSVNTPLLYKRGTVGQFLPGVEYKLEDVEGIKDGGKLLVKGPNIMKGYLIHNEGFKPTDEWYDTGDVVEIDKEGYISIKSRLKRFAKLGGEMVSLNLIEQLLEEKFHSSEFAVTNVPDKRKGEKIIVFTTLSDIDTKSFGKYIKEKKYSKLMIPSRFEVIEELPVLGSGKLDYVSIQKKALNTEPKSLWDKVTKKDNK